MKEKQIYISFENKDYKTNKADLLRCRVDIVRLQKHLIMLRAIRANKKRLIVGLSKMFSSSNLLIDRLSDKMPDSEVPKELQKKLIKKQIKSPKKKEKPFEVGEIEIEDDEMSKLDKELIALNNQIKSLI